MPGAVGQLAVERDADAGLAAVRRELRGNDPRVVDDQQVPGAEQAGQLGDRVIGELAGYAQQARSVSGAGGRLGDAFRRQGEVEIGGG